MDVDPSWQEQASLHIGLQVLDELLPFGLSVSSLVRLHTAILPPEDPANGQFRNGAGVVRLHGNVMADLPDPLTSRQIADTAMRWLDQTLRGMGKGTTALSVAEEAFFWIVRAHAFKDGNGRLARTVATWVLERGGYQRSWDMRLYMLTRTESHYRALKARQGAPPDPQPWRSFFATMVAYCFKPPPGDRKSFWYPQQIGSANGPPKRRF